MASLALTCSLNLRVRPFSAQKSRAPAAPKSLHLGSRFRSPIKNSISNSHNPLSEDQIQFATQKPAFLLPAPKRVPVTVASASSGASAGGSPAPQPWQGAAIKPLLASIATGVILWFVPAPNGVSRIAWQLLSIFLATIVGIITQPLPLGAVALMGLGACVLTKTLTFAAAFSAFGDPIPWLIALAFFSLEGLSRLDWGTELRINLCLCLGARLWDWDTVWFQ
ncbi:UNVERIFIED_CONTAM: Dicarboxylate transporter 1, chloroplastic [Sesamum angustifolium]|uniref:Dicarboxylate transporter 1, chloroplastic n=1 Tax=Sesamum angustifolium TaxID=2727405 RepID=A0AAW2QQU9_9LAMI